MPTVAENITSTASALGIPSNTTAQVLASITGAGQSITPSGGGSPATVSLSTPAELVAVVGRPLMLVEAVSLGRVGWLVTLVISAGVDGEPVRREGPAFVPRPSGDADDAPLFPAPPPPAS